MVYPRCAAPRAAVLGFQSARSRARIEPFVSGKRQGEVFGIVRQAGARDRDSGDAAELRRNVLCFLLLCNNRPGLDVKYWEVIVTFPTAGVHDDEQ